MDVPSPPVVSVLPTSCTWVPPVTSPVSDPMVSLVCRVKAVPLAIVRADPLGMALPPRKVRVPEAKVVVPL